MNIINPFYKLLLHVLPYRVVTKMALNGQKIYNRVRFGDANFPRAIAIEVTSHCNRSCSYCPQSVEPTGIRKIEESVYLSIMHRLKEINWQGPVDFHFYNEPLLDKKLEDKIDVLKAWSRAAMPRVLTNGDCLTDDRVKSLRNSGVFSIMVTRHENTKPEWDARIGELAIKYPRLVHVTPVTQLLLSNRGGLVNPAVTEAQRLRKEGCFAPSRCLHVSIDGDYIWCCCDYRKVNLLGNVKNIGIKDAWNQEQWKGLRERVGKSMPELDVCKACFDVKSDQVADTSKEIRRKFYAVNNLSMKGTK